VDLDPNLADLTLGELLSMYAAGHELEAVGSPAVGAEVLVGVRPENVTLSARPDSATSARNHFSGTVTRIVPRGPYFKVELDCGFALAAFVTPHSLEALALVAGSEVAAAFKATAVHLMTQRR